MVRCIDFYEKWAKEPNFCDKCAASVNNIDRYMALIEDVAKEFPDYGTKEDFYLILPEGRARPILKHKTWDARMAHVYEYLRTYKNGEVEFNQAAHPKVNLELAQPKAKSTIVEKPEPAPAPASEPTIISDSRDTTVETEADDIDRRVRLLLSVDGFNQRLRTLRIGEFRKDENLSEKELDAAEQAEYGIIRVEIAQSFGLPIGDICAPFGAKERHDFWVLDAYITAIENSSFERHLYRALKGVEEMEARLEKEHARDVKKAEVEARKAARAAAKALAATPDADGFVKVSGGRPSPQKPAIK